ncbi:MAG: hypothetical protein ACR2HJ_13325 [Fimbriimonadales bacterium]
MELSRGLEPSASAIARVAIATSAEDAAWAFTQWKLRGAARAKFEKADAMLFVREAMEQASHMKIARYRAAKFPHGELVGDLTAGIGADLIALAERGPVLGFEIVLERQRYAEHNLGVYGLSAPVHVADCLFASWPFSYAFADPSRRSGGRRERDPGHFSPDPFTLAKRMASLKLAGLKLSPMISDDAFAELGASLEFLSLGGECREATVWLGQDSESGRWAVLVESGDRLEALGAGASVAEPVEYFYEADPAAIRAHCLGTLAERHGLALLGDSNGYVTARRLVQSPWLTAYRTVASGAFHERSIRKDLSAQGGATPDIKTRGVAIDVRRLRQSLRSEGRQPCWVAIYPVGSRHRYAILVKD